MVDVLPKEKVYEQDFVKTPTYSRLLPTLPISTSALLTRTLALIDLVPGTRIKINNLQ